MSSTKLALFLLLSTANISWACEDYCETQWFYILSLYKGSERVDVPEICYLPTGKRIEAACAEYVEKCGELW